MPSRLNPVTAVWRGLRLTRSRPEYRETPLQPITVIQSVAQPSVGRPARMRPPVPVIAAQPRTGDRKCTPGQGPPERRSAPSARWHYQAGRLSAGRARLLEVFERCRSEVA